MHYKKRNERKSYKSRNQCSGSIFSVPGRSETFWEILGLILLHIFQNIFLINAKSQKYIRAEVKISAAFDWKSPNVYQICQRIWNQMQTFQSWYRWSHEKRPKSGNIRKSITGKRTFHVLEKGWPVVSLWGRHLGNVSRGYPISTGCYIPCEEFLGVANTLDIRDTL